MITRDMTIAEILRRYRRPLPFSAPSASPARSARSPTSKRSNMAPAYTTSMSTCCCGVEQGDRQLAQSLACRSAFQFIYQPPQRATTSASSCCPFSRWPGTGHRRLLRASNAACPYQNKLRKHRLFRRGAPLDQFRTSGQHA